MVIVMAFYPLVNLSFKLWNTLISQMLSIYNIPFHDNIFTFLWELWDENTNNGIYLL